MPPNEIQHQGLSVVLRRRHNIARRLVPAAALAAVLSILAACDRLAGIVGEVCAGVGMTGIIAEVRTSAGAPAVIGATLIATDGSFADTVGPVVTVPSGGNDSVHMGAAENRGGLYTVRVTKPNWTTDVRLVRVPGGRCGYVETQHIRLTIDPLPGAPPVRGVAVEPRALRFGFCGSAVLLAVAVDTDAGVTRDVRWSSSDTAVVRVSQTGYVSVRSRGRATIRATSVADSSAQGYSNVVVEPVCP